MYQPDVIVQEFRSGGGGSNETRIRLPLLEYDKELGEAVKHHRHLVRVCSCYPTLRRLRIDLSPTPPGGTDDDSDEADISSNPNHVERLIDVVSWFVRSAIQLKSDARIGPHPWCLLGTSTVERLELVATFSRPMEPSPEENEETCYRISPLMGMCAISCARSLRSLDLTGIGPGVLSELLSHSHTLDQLRVLRLGEASNQHIFGWTFRKGSLGAIGRAFPGLTALDVGYANFSGGVSFEDVEHLVVACKQMQHLDLSQVMTYMDFGPALQTLARKAPNLRSLATHGLILPTPQLLELATGCPLLERVHFVAWKGVHFPRGGAPQPPRPEDILIFLRACPHLAHADISAGIAPKSQLLTWLEERHKGGHPVETLVMHECTVIDDGRALLDMADMERLKEFALAISPNLSVSIGRNAGCEAERMYYGVGADKYLWLPPRRRLFEAIGLC